MLATMILDAYKKEEALEVAIAINDLCDPSDTSGWASAGIYCYWDYYTKEVLYIGLAVDLAERFKQHNGIIPMDERGCKREQINEYFESNDKIGISIFVESPLDQPNTSRNKNSGIAKKLPDHVSLRNDPLRQNIVDIEGILLDAYREEHGKLPKWNKIGGGRSRMLVVSRPDSYDLIRYLTNEVESLLVSKYSIRELSANATFERYENFIMHPARFYLLYMKMNFNEALQHVLMNDELNTYREMLRKGYFGKNLNI